MLQKPARILLTGALIIALSGAMSSSSALAASGDVGTVAVDFDLTIFQGGGATQSLSALSGKAVLLNIIGYS